MTRLQEEDTQRLLQMEEILHQRVIGQDEAVKASVPCSAESPSQV